MKRPQVEQDSVFLNVPYDDAFKDAFVSYLCGLVALGLTPRATLAIPGGVTRLDRIFELIQSCRYSLHDLSRVELDLSDPPTPRFNMPMELGMTVAWAKLYPKRHTWFIFETRVRRTQKSISDLSGTDCNIHGGTVEGVMRELCNAFVRRSDRAMVPQMLALNEAVKIGLPSLMRSTGAASLFEARIFEDIVTLALELHVAA
jgi:hypothetical protein